MNLKKILFNILGISIGLFFITPVYPQNVSSIKDLLSSEGKILYGDEPNSILVIDYPENIKKVEEYLAMVDVPPQQVLIEARVVEVKLEGEHSLGVNWSSFGDMSGFRIGKFKVRGPDATSPIQQNIPYKPTFYPPLTQKSENEETPFTITIFDENINIVLKALANTLETNILSAPRVTTVNNREAEIKIIQKIPWAEPEVSELEGGGVTVTWNINWEEVGITLRVTPTITGDGNISMEIEPEVSEHVDDYPLTVISGATQVPYTVPIIDERSAKTKVVIGNGQTLIIGGLIKDKTESGVTKVPLLGDLPGLGWLFRSKKDTKEKTELLIFVSPTVITPQVIARMEKQEKFGVGKWYMKERKEKEEEIGKREERQQKKLALQIDKLEKKVDTLINKRKGLETLISPGED